MAAKHFFWLMLAGLALALFRTGPAPAAEPAAARRPRNSQRSSGT